MATRAPLALADRHTLLQPRYEPAPADCDVWTVDDVALYLRCSDKHVRNMATRGHIPGKKVGQLWRFNRAAIQGLL